WLDHSTAASAAACGAAAEVPANGRGRHRLGNGTTAIRSGLGCFELGPHELYETRCCSASTAPTATTSGPSAGNATLPGVVVQLTQPPSDPRWTAAALPPVSFRLTAYVRRAFGWNRTTAQRGPPSSRRSRPTSSPLAASRTITSSSAPACHDSSTET